MESVNGVWIPSKFQSSTADLHVMNEFKIPQIKKLDDVKGSNDVDDHEM